MQLQQLARCLALVIANTQEAEAALMTSGILHDPCAQGGRSPLPHSLSTIKQMPKTFLWSRRSGYQLS